MASTIKIKNSSTASAVPTSSDLVQGELAVNVTDKRIFTENASGTVVELGTNPSILTIPDGSASAPTLTNDGDTNTGIFFPAADTVAVATGGTERVRVDSSGNVGVGTSSPFAPLAVNKAQGAASTLIGVQNDGTAGTSTKAGLGFFDASVVRAAIVRVRDGASSPISIETYDTTPILFGTNNTERARIDSSGNLLVGTTNSNPIGSNVAGIVSSPSGNFSVSRDAAPALDLNRYTSDGTLARFYRSASQVGRIDVTTTATSYVTSSDYRLKENAQPMVGALSTIAQLKPCTYTWKINGEQGQGFIAHELQEVIPECVVGLKDEVETVEIKDADGNVVGTEEQPVYQGIDTSFLVATLTAAIQEQQAIITQLQADVEALKGQ